VKPRELREKRDVELEENLEALQKELWQAQFRAGQDEVEERGHTKKVRREVARIRTILRERELGIRAAKGGEES
jgi:large subunit ribosomal protein L29